MSIAHAVFRRILAHRAVKQAGKILVFLAISKLVSALAGVWAARCLGPANLGISGMIFASIAQLTLLATGSLDSLWIRNYKHCANPAKKRELIAMAISQRFFLSTALAIGVVFTTLILGLGAEWRLGIAAGVPLFIVSCLHPTWVIVAEENASLNYKAAAISSMVTAIIYLAFFHPNQPPGSDVVVAFVGATITFVILAAPALGQRWPPPIRFDSFRDSFQSLSEGRWMFVTGLVIYLYVSFDLPLLGYLCSLVDAGKYRAAASLVGSIQQILAIAPMLLYPRFVEWGKTSVAHLWRRQIHIFWAATAVLAPISLITFLTAPWAIRTLFGDAFADAAYPFAILLTSKFIVVLNGIFAQGLWAQAKDAQVFRVVFPVALVSLTLNVLLIPSYGMLAAALVNLLSESLILVGCFGFALRQMRQHAAAETTAA